MSEHRVTLSREDYLRAVSVGAMRQAHSVLRGGRDSHGYKGTADGSAWGHQIEGACAELAVAVWAGVPWTGEGVASHFGGADVAGCQVRHGVPRGPYAHQADPLRWHGRLIVRQRDRDDAPYVLVVGCNGLYRIAGWCYGHEAKVEANLWDGGHADRPPAYYVSQPKLRDPAALRDLLRSSIQEKACVS